MAEFPSMPLWTDAYLADTRHLSTKEHGAYLLLLMEAWRRPSCSLPDDEELLARLAGVSLHEWDEIRDNVLSFWTHDGRRKEWKQMRLVRERTFVAQKSASQRDNALRRWDKTKKRHATAMPNTMPTACQNDAPIPTTTYKKNNSLRSLQKDDEKTDQEAPKRGTRLTRDWRPSDEIRRWVEDQRFPPGFASDQFERFQDHFISSSTASATKKDWNAAFRNWMKRAADDLRKRGGGVRRMNAIEAGIASASNRMEIFENGSEIKTIDHGDAQRLSADKPGLPDLFSDAGKALRWNGR